jgi:glycosyltransferase involved in cell wall biosynthesis
LGIADKVDMPGNVPFDQVPSYLEAADIFCFASITETQGLVTLEAMAAGLPVVAVYATGTADAVTNGVQGLLVPNDSAALAEAIERVVVDKELRQQFSEASLVRAEEFELTRQTKRLLQVYEQAIEDKKAGFVITADKHKPIFKIEWRDFFGLS